jgi:hypothetical protein
LAYVDCGCDQQFFWYRYRYHHWTSPWMAVGLLLGLGLLLLVVVEEETLSK